MRWAQWALALVSTAWIALFGLVGAGGTAAAATAVPYTDPNVSGYIGLCNQAGQQVTSGSVSTAPFVARAVSSQAAPSPYDESGRTAILTAYLPIQSLPPGDWSGEQLTASSRYTNPQSPMAQATSRDISLQTFVEDYPPRWEGFVQLRMLLGAPDQPAYVKHYAALDLEVSGDTWTAVGGGSVNCNAGSAESLETVLLPTSTTTTVRSSGGGPGANTSTTRTSGAASGTRASTPSSGGSNPSALNGDATVAAKGSSHATGLLAVLAVVLVAIVAAIVLVARRLRTTRLSSADSQTTVKGPPS